MKDRTESKRLYHLRHKERRNAEAKARYYADRDTHNARTARRRAAMTPADREAKRAKDRVYRATRKAQDASYRKENRERIQKLARESYLRRKKPKRDPIAAAKRLAAKAAAVARGVLKNGYEGPLRPNGF